MGKVFHRGRFALDYGGGSQDFEIVEWMLAMRDELQRGRGRDPPRREGGVVALEPSFGAPPLHLLESSSGEPTYRVHSRTCTCTQVVS